MAQIEAPRVLAALHAKGFTKTAGQFEVALKALSDGLEAGAIPNARLSEYKHTLSSAQYRAWGDAASFPKFSHDKTMPMEIRESLADLWSEPTLQNVKRQDKAIKVLEGLLSTPEQRNKFSDMKALRAEMLNVRQAINDGQAIAVKKKPKAEKPAEPRYTAPAASKTATGQVQGFLEKICEARRGEIIAQFGRAFDRYERVFLECKAKAEEQGKAYGLGAHSQRPYACSQEQSVLQAMYEWKGTRKPDADLCKSQLAVQYTDEMIKGFISKNVQKLASIVETRGDYASIKLRGPFHPEHMEGEFTLSFQDGARFDIRTKAVHGISSLGKNFVRFPSTFHNAVLANDVAFIAPSEERMNTLFAKKMATEREVDAPAL